MLELKLGGLEWKKYIKRNQDQRFLSFKKRVHERDESTCKFCGFKAQRFMDVVNRDGNYSNNKINNLITACPLCSQCNFVEYVGKSEFGGGTLIFLPEMTQEQLNGLCHVLFCSITNTADFSQKAQNIYNALRLRSKVVEKYLGEHTSSPSHLGQMLTDTPLENNAFIASEVLKSLRLLPSMSKFADQVEVWAKSALDLLNLD
ncbi:MAG TPA: type IVB secretion system protein IcmJDotN [Gammaproteobacteria bacterium]|nr:type IVB secretion system protein IcmJDotN [Gammaproteobacteria bacterium]